MRRRGRHEKTMKTMDKILIIIGVFLLIFTITMIWLFKTTYAVPDTLITCVFAALGGECGAMAWIKTNKDKQQEREWQLEDEKRQREYIKENDNNDY